MTLEAIAAAALRRDGLQLRSLVQDLIRSEPSLGTIPRPAGDDPGVLEMSASLVELLAIRLGQAAPAWTSEVGGLAEPFFLLEAAHWMPRLRTLCETESPEPLRKRGFYAPPDFLTFA